MQIITQPGDPTLEIKQQRLAQDINFSDALTAGVLLSILSMLVAFGAGVGWYFAYLLFK